MELNAEQIKKALGRCKSPKLTKCDGCPREKEDGHCMYRLNEDALALITSQEQRIGELTEESERLRNRITCQVVLPDEKLEEIKNECLERVELDIKKIEADTVRKMQERLHKRFKSDRDAIYTGYNIHRYIDQIAKEMLEGEK